MQNGSYGIPFWKMSGSGNDFIIVDNRSTLIKPTQLRHFVSKVCRRGLSVGADGVILVESSNRADYQWHYLNADGGEVAMCGNGTRCVARFAYLQKIAPAKHVFETAVGLIDAEILGEEEDRVRTRLPDPSDIRLDLSIDLPSGTKVGHFANTGVPHVIYFEEDLSVVDLMGIGRATRLHPLFMPEGTNVNFVQRIDPHTLKMRTYERGVENETLACGTGSIAAALIATALGQTSSPVTIQTQGGTELIISFTTLGKTAYTDIRLEGDAMLIYKGVLEPEAFL